MIIKFANLKRISYLKTTKFFFAIACSVVLYGGCAIEAFVGFPPGTTIESSDTNALTVMNYSVEYMRDRIESGELDPNGRIKVEGRGLKVSPLFMVWYKGGHDLLTKATLLLDSGADPNFAYEDRTLLMCEADASTTDDSDFSNLLIQSGADVNATNRSGMTALYWATLRGNVSYVELLLNNGAIVDQDVIDCVEDIVQEFCNPESDYYSGWDPSTVDGFKAFCTIPKLIYSAAEEQDFAIAENATLYNIIHDTDNEIIEEMKTSSSIISWMPLIAAAYCDSRILEYLYDQGLDLNSPIKSGRMNETDDVNTDDSGNSATMLWVASLAGNYEGVEFLVQNGASTDSADYEAQSGTAYSQTNPLVAAVEEDHPDIAAYLLDHGMQFNITEEQGDGEFPFAGGRLLKAAAANGDTEMMDLLKIYGYPFSVDICSQALWTAIDEKQSEASEYLFENGLNFRPADGVESIASFLLDECAKNGTVEILKQMKDHGLQFGLANTYTLQNAAEYNADSEVLQWLLDNGISTDLKVTEMEYTFTNMEGALYVAIDNGYIEKAKILLERGAHVNSTAMPVLESAARQGRHITEFLLDEGADVNLQDEDTGTTALMGAAEWNTTSSIKLLLEAGADPTIQDNEGKTAYDHAKEAGAKDAMKLLK
ncbi:MAG: ankyrin repeat domain-containing protein [Clostridiales Family XIII bacterium]|nr:ankyrin repeat domain-containing protein [Clostridiales Family XIII bacterium]